jgi:hypothetical protein
MPAVSARRSEACTSADSDLLLTKRFLDTNAKVRAGSSLVGAYNSISESHVGLVHQQGLMRTAPPVRVFSATPTWPPRAFGSSNFTF